MAIGSQPFMYMRTEEFSQINKESERILLDLILCFEGRAIIYTGSGTGAMSAVVENYVTTKQKAFVLDARLKQLNAESGETGNLAKVRQRAIAFRDLCRRYGWEVFADTPSFVITGFQSKDNEQRRISKGLKDKYDTFIMPGSVPGFYRVSHMGLQSRSDLEELAASISEFENA